MQWAEKLSSAVTQSLSRSVEELWRPRVRLQGQQPFQSTFHPEIAEQFKQKQHRFFRFQKVRSWAVFCLHGLWSWATAEPEEQCEGSQLHTQPLSTQHSIPPVQQLALSYIYLIFISYSKSSNLQEITCFYYGGSNCRNLATASQSRLRETPFDKSPNDSISAFSTHLTCGLYFKQVKRKGWPTHGSRHFSPLEHHVFSYPPVGVHIDTLILIAHQHLHPVRLGQDDNGVRSNIALNLQVKQTLRVRITLNGERGRGKGAEPWGKKAQTN